MSVLLVLAVLLEKLPGGEGSPPSYRGAPARPSLGRGLSLVFAGPARVGVGHAVKVGGQVVRPWAEG
jgi:hypothetical protein